AYLFGVGVRQNGPIVPGPSQRQLLNPQQRGSHMVRRSIQIACVGLLASVVASGETFAQDTYRVSGGEVTVVCPLTVGGSFEAKTTKVTGAVGTAPDSSGAVPGAVKVDLQTLETGIGLRDRHMREKYLEVDKGPDFAVATIEGIQIDKKEGRTAF